MNVEINARQRDNTIKCFFYFFYEADKIGAAGWLDI